MKDKIDQAPEIMTGSTLCEDGNSLGLTMNKVQLLLAEKRTSLASLRTGMAIIAMPITVISFLIVTSKYYDFASVFHMIAPVGVLCFGLAILGIYIIHRAVTNIRHQDFQIQMIKKKNSFFTDLIIQ
jgi:uncharacterized membrane protein YkgB